MVTEIFEEEYNTSSVIAIFRNNSKDKEEKVTTTRSIKSSVSSNSQKKKNSVKSTSATKLHSDSIITTNKANNGLHVQSTNAIVYVTLITFMFHLSFLF
jgi:hypothetical protein